MSLSERPTHEGRPRLTLLRVGRSPAVKATSAQRPPTDRPCRSTPYDARTLSKPYLARKLGDLAQILGVDAEALPPILRGRVPSPLRVGIRADLIARYPAADPDRIGRWLAQWSSTDQYQRQLAGGGPRYDLDGAHTGEITAEQADAARLRWAGRASPACIIASDPCNIEQLRTALSSNHEVDDDGKCTRRSRDSRVHYLAPKLSRTTSPPGLSSLRPR